LPNLEERSAAQLLRATKLHAARPLVAFDVLERTLPKERDKNASTRAPTFKAIGDGQLFKAIDSSVSAAFYWRQQDYSDAHPFVVLNVPVFLLSIPFWDVCIDHAKVGEPTTQYRGFQSNSYPDRPSPPTQAMVLVWTRDELPSLVQALDRLFAWLLRELRKPDCVLLWSQ
jgi:hypothetical protein